MDSKTRFSNRVDHYVKYRPSYHKPGSPDFEAMMAELTTLFDHNQMNGKVDFDYETLVYWGEL